MAEDPVSACEPFQESVDYVWTERAFRMLERGDLRGEIISRDGIVLSHVRGPCPRCGHCGHALDDRQTHTAITNLMGADPRGRSGIGRGQQDDKQVAVEFLPVDVSCGCGDSHPGAPEGTTGCGVSFRVELPVSLPDDRDRP